MLINLIGSELLAAFFLPLDFLGSISRGKIYERYPVLCPISGFAHSFFGKQLFIVFLSNNKKSFSKYFMKNIQMVC